MPFNAALSGLQTSNSQLRVLSNNIANASTTGFKKSRAEFRDVFASGALGSSANIIGTGVKLTSVSQQFTQGIINSADTNLDLAINGSGFFVLDDDGSRFYSRNGAFRVDKDGNISNSQNQQLIGFLTDANGNITGAQGTLAIQNNSLDPQSTESVTVQLNLDASATPPAQSFTTGFVPGNEPPSTTFNNSASTQIFDSLGQSHILTTYYVKAPAERTWNIFVGVDGTDVTPSSSSIPAGGTPTSPSTYNSTDIANPFTIVFDQTGNVVQNNSASPAQYFGPSPIASSESANFTTTYAAGSVPTLDIGDLTINGVQIAVSTITDTVSSTDNSASMITIVDAINDRTGEHKVTASPVSTIWESSGLSFDLSTSGLATGDLTINGIQIVTTTGVSTISALVSAINNSNGSNGVPGVAASTGTSGQLRLTATDGRNIQISSDGVTTSGLHMDNFAIDGGASLSRVRRGHYTLSIADNKGITIGGSQPTDVGLTAGTQAGIFQNNSDIFSITFNPGTGASTPQTVSIDLSSSTQFASPFSITALTQDGYSTGRLTSVDVDPTGIITARYGNGQSQQLGQVALANFRNTQGLQPQGDTTWAETFSSGVALLGSPGTSDLGLIQSGSLEDSNVQLTDELVSLIVAQRNFQANAQTIRTADAVTQTIINIR